jgi:hypothetical protein
LPPRPRPLLQEERHEPACVVGVDAGVRAGGAGA